MNDKMNGSKKIGRKQITVVNHFFFLPPQMGGSIYIYDFYLELSRWFDINIITIVMEDFYQERISINEHLHVYPMALSHNIMQRKSNYQLPELFVSNESVQDEGVLKKVSEIASDSVIVIAEHCYMWKLIKKTCKNCDYWYRAHNVEYDFVIGRYGIRRDDESARSVYEIENDCCKGCDTILTISQADRERFIGLYASISQHNKQVYVLGVGYNVDKITKSASNESKNGLNNRVYRGLFISSVSQDAISAAYACMDIAKKFPHIQIIVAGGVGDALQRENVPKNVCILGIITDREKEYLLSNCDFALNILEAGAGVNIKMLEYMAYKLPIITTDAGARGIMLKDGVHCIITEKNRYDEDVKRFCSLSSEEKEKMAENAYSLINKEYNWRSITERLVAMTEKRYSFSFNDVETNIFGGGVFDKWFDFNDYPQKPYYIRCAGNIGVRCYELLKRLRNEPIAFVDESKEKRSTGTAGIKTISVDEYMDDQRDTAVIIASVNAVDRAAELIRFGINIDDMLVTIDGTNIISLDNNRKEHYFISKDKIRRRIQELVERERR
ncbi:MAG: glycosyltransferase family 4 protein [Lachnospiraceae bacterium]|nr:glycosyltransferase family 4 protein [Lachnospiraceae bacterium]